MTVSLPSASKKNSPAIVLLTLVLFVGFCLFVVLHKRQLVSEQTARVEDHAKVVSGSLWTFEQNTSRDYLDLAMKANRYRRMVVTDTRDQVFLQYDGTLPSLADRVFSVLQLIPVHRFTAPIVFEDQPIGTIAVDWPCRAIYTYLYVFFCLALLHLGLTLYLQVLDAKRLLETRVKERTQDLEKEIQERRKTEKELKYQTQRLTMHVQNTPLGVVEWDNEFRVVEWNRAAESIFGFNREEMLGRQPFGTILPDNDDENVNSVLHKLVADQGSDRSINVNLDKNGQVRTCSWYNTTLKDETGAVIGVGSLVMDITDQVEAEKKNKSLQQQLLQAQKMEAVGNLAGGIAHDFNNLLQAISGYTQLLLKHCQDQAQIKRLAGIEKSIHRAAGLVRQLLTFSRKIESHLEPLDLNREIRQIRSILARTLPKMVAIRLDLEPDLRLINGDPIQLEQVLLNLAINANHAMPEGGALTITTANVDLDKVFVSAHLGTKEGANVMLRVADTGVGMDAQTVERIFEPFFTTKETGKGTGLGLATVYGIVREHGACITCDSAIGQGTVFTLYFPALEESAQAAVNKPMGTVEDLPAGGAETVLLVDDEPMILDIGSEMLRQHGYTILTASSGEEALQRYQRYREEIAVVVLDLNMPGMGGFKCLEQLKRMDDRVLVLVASGFVPAESVQRATNLGADGFLPKPFKLQELMQSIRAVLDRKDRLPTGA